MSDTPGLRTPFDYALAGGTAPDGRTSPSAELAKSLRAMQAELGDTPVIQDRLRGLLANGFTPSAPRPEASETDTPELGIAGAVEPADETNTAEVLPEPTDVEDVSASEPGAPAADELNVSDQPTVNGHRPPAEATDVAPAPEPAVDTVDFYADSHGVDLPSLDADPVDLPSPDAAPPNVPSPEDAEIDQAPIPNIAPVGIDPPPPVAGTHFRLDPVPPTADPGTEPPTADETSELLGFDPEYQAAITGEVEAQGLPEAEVAAELLEVPDELPQLSDEGPGVSDEVPDVDRPVDLDPQEHATFGVTIEDEVPSGLELFPEEPTPDGEVTGVHDALPPMPGEEYAEQPERPTIIRAGEPPHPADAQLDWGSSTTVLAGGGPPSLPDSENLFAAVATQSPAIDADEAYLPDYDASGNGRRIALAGIGVAALAAAALFVGFRYLDSSESDSGTASDVPAEIQADLAAPGLGLDAADGSGNDGSDQGLAGGGSGEGENSAAVDLGESGETTTSENGLSTTERTATTRRSTTTSAKSGSSSTTVRSSTSASTATTPTTEVTTSTSRPVSTTASSTSTTREATSSTTSTSSTTTSTTSTTSTTVTQPTTTEPPSTTSSSTTSSSTSTTVGQITIGGRAFRDSVGGEGVAGVSVGLARDTDGDGAGDRFVDGAQTSSTGRFLFRTEPGCYSAFFTPPQGGEIDPAISIINVCLDAGESDLTIDSVVTFSE